MPGEAGREAPVAGPVMAGQPVRGRGRPRSPGIDRAILAAAMKLFLERGFDGTSIEAVARDAGVAKTAVYRRYRDKVDVITAAVAAHLRVADIPDTGSFRGDLLAIMAGDVLATVAGPGATMLGRLLAERERNPALIATFRQRIVEPRRRQYHAIFQRALARGEVRPDVEHQTVAAALFGSMIGRVIIGEEINREAAGQAVDLVLRGLAPRP